MQFEWDPEKARTIRIKHGVSFDAAMQVWKDPRHAVRLNDYVDGEERLEIIGVVGSATTLLVIFTDRDGTLRITSARKATPRERRRYEEQRA